MPSDGSGNYSLPAGYLAVTGDTIVISQHNPIFEDVASALSARIMASGVRPMTGPLKLADGTVSLPALALASQPSWGLYKTATGFGLSISATKVAEFTPTLLDVVNGLTVGKTATLKDGGDIASATALVLGDGNFFNITGTTASTSIGTKGVGTVVKLRANEAWPITHHATDLILLTGASITAAAGDMMEFEEYATGQWRMTAYHKASGAPLTNAQVTPQGRLTLTSATPVLAADVIAATTVYYTPYNGNFISIYNGTTFVTYTFAELSMAMSGANFAAGGIYDLFVANDAGTLRLGIGPVWSTLTAGAGARGTGAGTTELQRLNGLWTNKVSMTLRYASGSTVSVGANQGTYVGSMYMDGTNSQVTCHFGYGQSRKWGIWNAFNRVPIYLKAGDGTASWNYNSATLRASNGSSANSLTIFAGLQEESFALEFNQMGNAGALAMQSAIFIGYNSTTVQSGVKGTFGYSNTAINPFFNMTAKYIAPPALGVNVVTALESTPTPGGASNQTFNGTEANMLLSGLWRG